MSMRSFTGRNQGTHYRWSALYRFLAVFCCLIIPLHAFPEALPERQDALEPGMILLDGPDAKLLGRGIGNQDGFLRNWNGRGSGAEWTVHVDRPGAYGLYFEYACPPSEGGSLEILVDGERRESIDVAPTRGFHDFTVARFVDLELARGTHTLTVKAGALKKTYLMDIRYGILSAGSDAGAVERLAQREEQLVRKAEQTKRDFPSALACIRETMPSLLFGRNREQAMRGFRERYPHQCEWLEQDTGGRLVEFLRGGEGMTAEWLYRRADRTMTGDCDRAALPEKGMGEEDWLRAYERLAWRRRQDRLRTLREKGGEVIFAKHHVFGSVSGIYLITETEGSNAPSSLCLVNLNTERNGRFAPVRTLFDPGDGIVRDPELSFDAKRLLFAMRPTRRNFVSTYSNQAKGRPEMNYQIYEMDLASGNIRQLTDTGTYGSSFEPCYLPNGDIMFSSARIVQHITCGWGDCSNLYLMDGAGRYARRVGFDQTNTAFPVLMNDGRVMFTRRDYNDRGQSSAHALFVMNPDGTGQTQLYGNQTGLPNSFHHARPILGSRKVVTIIGGYHTTQGGKLALLDPGAGTEKDEGLVQLPGYTKPVVGDGYNDTYGKDGTQYSNPFPLSEREYLVSIAERNANGVHYGLYYMNDRGERELLASDPQVSCLQPVLKAPRPSPARRPSSVDYTKKDGVFYVQNVYFGEAAKGIRPGTVKKLRVVEILYKPCTIGTSRGVGPGGCWDTVTPSGHGLATFDSKRILGDATVYEDGSAKFVCDARRPVYFQLLDDKNRVVQTMRSWTLLMPGENFSCVGCHERKKDAPPARFGRTIALTRPAEQLVPFYGPPRAFSYPAEVQPVFDRHCIACHREGGKAARLVLTARPYVDDKTAKKRFYRSYFNLTAARPANGHQPSEFGFYPNDPIWGGRVRGRTLPDEPNRYVSWYTRFELMKPYPPCRSGSIRSGLVRLLEEGHQGVDLSQEELDKIKAWIDLNIPFAGEYDESNLWSADELRLYRERQDERVRNERIERDNIAQFIRDGQPS